MNGLINQVFPLFDAIDGLLAAGLPAVVRLVVWGVLSGIVAMLGYWLASNQSRIRAQQQVIAGIKQELKANDEEFDAVMQASMRNLRASFKLLGMVTLPAVLSGLPVLVVILWVSGQFGLVAPATGDVVPIEVTPAEVGLIAEPAAALEGETGNLRLLWPAEPADLVFSDPTGIIHIGLVSDPPVNVIHKRRWWNTLLGNEAGYLAPQAEIDVLRMEMQRLYVLPGLPGWMSSWELTFFVTIIVTSLLIKSVFRIA